MINSPTIIVQVNRTTVIPVDLGFSVAGDTLTSEIRTEPGGDLICTWDVDVVGDGTSGELILTLDNSIISSVTHVNGVMDIKRVHDGKPYAVFAKPLEVEFKAVARGEIVPPLEDDHECIPDVMGSELWVAPFDGPMTYEPDFYWNEFGSLGPQAMFWPTLFTETQPQSIEVTVSTWGPLNDGGDVLALYCRSTDINDSNAGLLFWSRKYEDPDDGPLWHWFVAADNVDIFTPEGDFPSGLLYWTYGDLDTEVTIRLESDVDGNFRVYINNTLLIADFDATLSAGPTQIGWYVDRYAPGDIHESIHVSGICMIGTEAEP